MGISPLSTFLLLLSRLPTVNCIGPFRGREGSRFIYLAMAESRGSAPVCVWGWDLGMGWFVRESVAYPAFTFAFAFVLIEMDEWGKVGKIEVREMKSRVLSFFLLHSE